MFSISQDEIHTPYNRSRRHTKQYWNNIIKMCQISSFLSEPKPIEEEVGVEDLKLEKQIEAFEKYTTFCTGSSYSGLWNQLGMDGYGTYTYQHGCEYRGEVKDGRFHGQGTLIYPMGQRLKGVWDKGVLVSHGGFTNDDGLAYSENWEYCQFPDRRFRNNDLQPAGREQETNQQPTRPVPPSMYDTGDGFYDPQTKTIIMARDLHTFETKVPETKDVISEENEEEEDNYWMKAIQTVKESRQTWIVENCRKGWDENVGYCPKFYPDWITGKKKEIQEMDDNYKQEELVEKESSSLDYSL